MGVALTVVRAPPGNRTRTGVGNPPDDPLAVRSAPAIELRELVGCVCVGASSRIMCDGRRYAATHPGLEVPDISAEVAYRGVIVNDAELQDVVDGVL